MIEEITIKTHNNIYTNEERRIPFVISVPDAGINDDTTLLILSYGYQGHYRSSIYQKLMSTLPNKFNMVVATGEFFGGRFMKNGKIEMDIGNNFYHFVKDGYYQTFFTEENEHDFNDMGVMQALDTIYITFAALEYMGKSSEEVKQIILFGSSHGGYLTHLANIYCPYLYTYLLDVSSYYFPYYLDRPRKLDYETEVGNFKFGINYFLSYHPQYHIDYNLMNLDYLYSTVTNYCRIISFHGTEDWMVDYREKCAVIKNIGPLAEFMLFDPNGVDGKFIKNADHSLGMDFEVLFDMIIPVIMGTTAERIKIPKDDVVIGEGKLVLDYSLGVPVLKHIAMQKDKQ